MKRRHSRLCLAALLALASPALITPSLAATAAQTPRPNSLAGVRTVRVDLSGAWKFNPSPPEDFWKEDASTATWQDIEVPGEWVMQGFDVRPDTAAAYRRAFIVPADWAGMRIKLRCDGVYSECTVWVNGRKAGGHLGGFTPFELDVTPLTQPGRDNSISLAVKNESLADTMASASFYAAHQLGGITRKLYLFAVPEANIASLHVATTFDKDYRDAALRVMADVANDGGTDLSRARIRFALIGPDGKAVQISPSWVGISAEGPNQILGRSVEIPVAAPRKWDAEHPNLYTLTCELEVGGKLVETVTRRFGFRQVEIRGNKFLVNSRPIKLRGVCRHEAHPTRGRSLTPELSRKDAELFRAMNCNFIRTSHYPPAEEFIEACDELGLYVEEEAPFCWVNVNSEPERLAYTLQATLEMVERDRSHPSIIQWSLANESDPLGTDFSPSDPLGTNFRSARTAVKKLDPTRPTTVENRNLGMQLDPSDCERMHYPHPEMLAEKTNNPTPVLFGEYCATNCYNRRELITDPGLRSLYGRGIREMWDKIYSAPAFVGGAIWSGIDDVFILPKGMKTSYVGYGEWGPLDGWRREKPEYWGIRAAYSPIRILTQKIDVPKPGRPIKIEIENRYDFTNLSEVKARWSFRESKSGKMHSGIVKLNVPPRSRGQALIDLADARPGREPIVLSFHDRRGFLIDSYELRVGGVPDNVAPEKIDTKMRAVLHESPDVLTVVAKDRTWEFDRKTGLIRSGRTAGGGDLIIGGPHLMISPLVRGTEGGDHMTEDPKPMNETLSGWKADLVAAHPDGRSVMVEVSGRYDNAVGKYRYRVMPDGALTVDYEFTMQSAIDPREIGVVFDTDGSLDELSTGRSLEWENEHPVTQVVMPRSSEHHLLARGSHTQAKPGVEPKRPWGEDATPQGTNDFRSTKYGIGRASLSRLRRDNKGTDWMRSVSFKSDGHQNIRCWVDGERIRVLITYHSNCGADPFYTIGIVPDRMPLEKGSVVRDSVEMTIAGRAP